MIGRNIHIHGQDIFIKNSVHFKPVLMKIENGRYGDYSTVAFCFSVPSGGNWVTKKSKGN